jgi:hypothetical protein
VKISQKIQMIKISAENLTSLTFLDIFMQNGKEGNGDVFSQENIIIALVA